MSHEGDYSLFRQQDKDERQQSYTERSYTNILSIVNSLQIASRAGHHDKNFSQSFCFKSRFNGLREVYIS